MSADVGVVGLGGLGQRLVADLLAANHEVVAYNRGAERAERVLSEYDGGARVARASSTAELVQRLTPPRRVILAITSGRAPDDVLDQLVPLLEPGDGIVDAGNAHYADTTRRSRNLEEREINFLGAGISGLGTRHGPAITVGGSHGGWELLKDVLQSIAGRSASSEPYCDRVGEGGAGHFVKMVHNGIEYADLQLIGDAYHLLRCGLCLTAEEAQRVFADWNRTELASYLVEITARILAAEDDDGSPLVEKILDVADQRGTGGWVVEESIALGVPATVVGEAVHARSLSAMKEDRVSAAALLGGPDRVLDVGRDEFIEDLRLAMLATRAVSYTQAFMLIERGAAQHGWAMDRSAVAAIWHGGSIISSTLLGEVRDALTERPDVPSLLFDDRLRVLVDRCQAPWRRVVSAAVERGLPVPAISSALAFYDGYRTSLLPASLLQAQRDYFAAHTYERVDNDRGGRFHTDWPGGAPRTV